MSTTELVQELKKAGSVNDSAFWKRIAKDLERSVRSRRVVNLSRLSRNTNPHDIVIVPGKVLAAGALAHSLTVAAYSFSTEARKQIEQQKGKALTIAELLAQNPKGGNVKIIG
ncbi:50S ribosomal protein L18e [Candidatus Woesearchaeota archaeon CG_4_10_14_0_2_um_filter_57_5]|nr:MAG: 50S ribosomal protein L18e [Candidatus Woesearchaeota archaeon CG1_02_57_44]PIN67582.1 MAG: 50S ribosomal protein L18e [Candidatus Woesearchaeota archaeon CG11_big_fil_rev_8_21_14_0_20_57_5]PIZ54521.1 MAG: 50S ribosomal protein L18e [Candidatus Woesearchaeota archaeon CG_4_10_14_0_2_um_filter_57_5]